LPADAKRANIIVEKYEKMQIMTLEFASRPGEGVYVKGDPPRITSIVMWKWGTRYGVLVEKKDRTWHATWFTPDEVPLIGRFWIVGGGKVEFDLAGRVAVPVPVSELKEMGLQPPLIPE